VGRTGPIGAQPGGRRGNTRHRRGLPLNQEKKRKRRRRGSQFGPRAREPRRDCLASDPNSGANAMDAEPANLQAMEDVEKPRSSAAQIRGKRIRNVQSRRRTVARLPYLGNFCQGIMMGFATSLRDAPGGGRANDAHRSVRGERGRQWCDQNKGHGMSRQNAANIKNR